MTSGWWSAFGKKKARNGKKPGPPVHDDLVRRVFTAAGPNQLWLLADITEHRTGEGNVYLCAVKDVFSNRIVGCSISDRMKSRITIDAAPARSPQGPQLARTWPAASFTPIEAHQFRIRKLARALRRHDLVGSMGRVGAAGDNAAMESFSPLLQKNVLDRRTWPPTTSYGWRP